MSQPGWFLVDFLPIFWSAQTSGSAGAKVASNCTEFSFCLGHFLWKTPRHWITTFILLLLLLLLLFPTFVKIRLKCQIMAKSWPSHGQVMASRGKSCQSHSCHLKPNLCPSHDLVISFISFMTSHGQVMAKSNGINVSKICATTNFLEGLAQHLLPFVMLKEHTCCLLQNGTW